jgi:hypothetical protein
MTAERGGWVPGGSGPAPEHAGPPARELHRKSPSVPKGSSTPTSHLPFGASGWNGKSGGTGPDFPGPRETKR